MKILKDLVKTVISILKEVQGILGYLWNVLYYKLFFLLLDPTPMRRFPYKREVSPNRVIAVLANGPSLKEDLHRIGKDSEFEDVDFSVMNFFANEPLYTQIKPKYYCLFDSMFDTPDERYEKVMSMYENMNKKTTWPMTLYTKVNEKRFREFSKVDNPNITVKTISSVSIRCSSGINHFFYRHGLAMPPAGTVANISVWVALQKGYKKIRLYGADMTFFEGLCVNENNQVCATMRHFYDTKVEIVPIYNYFAKRVFRLDEFIDMVNAMVKGHNALADYAKCLNAEILNCSKVSMLDCYPRKH